MAVYGWVQVCCFAILGRFLFCPNRFSGLVGALGGGLSSLGGYNGLPSVMSGLDESLSDVAPRKKYPFELEKAIHNVMFIQHHMQRQDEFNAVSIPRLASFLVHRPYYINERSLSLPVPVLEAVCQLNQSRNASLFTLSHPLPDLPFCSIGFQVRMLFSAFCYNIAHWSALIHTKGKAVLVVLIFLYLPIILEFISSFIRFHASAFPRIASKRSFIELLKKNWREARLWIITIAYTCHLLIIFFFRLISGSFYPHALTDSGLKCLDLEQFRTEQKKRQ